MSKDENPVDQQDQDWLTTLLDDPPAAIEMVERGTERGPAGVRCQYLEVLGMLPLALEEQAASPQLRERVLAAARSGEPAPIAAAPLPGATASRWLLPLAATLALAALGVAGIQTRRLGELQATIDRQAGELAAAHSAAGQMAELQARNSSLNETIAMLTSAGVEFCPLRPLAGSPMQAAWGAMAMSEGGRHWYLRIVGLEPREDRHEYRLWFLQDGTPMKGEILSMESADGVVELMNGEMPSRFNAVLITLEPPDSERPSGPRLLFGSDRMQIL